MTMVPITLASVIPMVDSVHANLMLSEEPVMYVLVAAMDIRLLVVQVSKVCIV